MNTSAAKVIAIDGPAASGKSTVARRLASELAIGWVNSGAFYRAITWWLLHEGAADSEAAAEAVLARTTLLTSFADGASTITLNGVDPSPHLRDANVNCAVSPVSQFSTVRRAVSLELQRLATTRDCVVEGRDIGTCVFPHTPHKFYIDASPEERHRRRLAQGQDDQIALRDRLDSQRALAPLVPAADAIVIDSTHLSIDQVLERILAHLLPRAQEARDPAQ